MLSKSKNGIKADLLRKFVVICENEILVSEL